MTFDEAYRNLNTAQKQAVDTIEGPVMVVAGPGTGKTQLLSMRVGNILRRTDALPNNILCLTFTESAAAAMRQRLLRLIGPEAYGVAIHTFHSFGSEIINHYPEYFYKGAHFRPADELSGFEVLEPIFKNLSHDSPLATTMNGQFTALKDTQGAIANLKKAGLAPEELLKIIDHNQAFIGYAEPLVAQVFDVPRFTKKEFGNCEALLNDLYKFQTTQVPVPLFKSLSTICTQELESALQRAIETNSTQPITKWRTRWLERNAQKSYVFKDHMRAKKLQALADVYHKYLLGMQERELFDFEDMILRVVHGLENFNDLRYNLQEKFLYVLVDEFQDTNGAQLRLLQNLTNNEVVESRPNIMVVGDDDQAIYAFQGAEIGNILQFRDLYRDPTIITLTDNYRSTTEILQAARDVITQGEYRLETTLENINKSLTPHTKQVGSTELHQFATPIDQYIWVAQHIKQHIASGTPASEIAVLGRNHRQLLEILPYLHEAGLQTHYERRNNILEVEHIEAIITLARVVTAMANQRFDIADSLLPKLLSYKFWGIKTSDLWQISLTAYKDRKFWLELMLERSDKLRAIAEFLIIASQLSQNEPLETMLDMLIGSNESQVAESEQAESEQNNHDGPHEEFISPLRAYYFNQQGLDTQPNLYLQMLSNLAVLRRKLRDYRPDKPLLLHDFVDFIDLHQKTNTPIVDAADYLEANQSIQLMTAHKAKGKEFEAVFIISSQESIWGASARTRSSSITFPANMPIEKAGTTADDCLRLFFVAMTRAKRRLYMSFYTTDEAGKESFPAAFIRTDLLSPFIHTEAISTEAQIAQLEPNWRQRHLILSKADKRTLLQPNLENYQLSSTHLNNFLDVTAGGPQAFLLQNLLRFPQAMNRSAVFGSVIHTVLQRAHTHFSHTGERRPIEDIMHDFELQLQFSRLSEHDFTYLFEKGSAILQNFLAKRYDSFKLDQKTEFSFAKQGVVIADARITGTLDLLEINKSTKTIAVTDYKTGKPSLSWQGGSEYEKIKLHRYRQQLMMYKCLVENSRDFGGKFKVETGILEFVEPNATGDITCLEMQFDSEELQRFEQLIGIVWRHILELNLPDTSHYSPNFKGILAFEDDLLQGKI